MSTVPKALLVEPDNASRASITHQLEACGFEVVAVSDAPSARPLFLTHSFDVVVSAADTAIASLEFGRPGKPGVCMEKEAIGLEAVFEALARGIKVVVTSGADRINSLINDALRVKGFGTLVQLADSRQLIMNGAYAPRLDSYSAPKDGVDDSLRRLYFDIPSRSYAEKITDSGRAGEAGVEETPDGSRTR